MFFFCRKYSFIGNHLYLGGQLSKRHIGNVEEDFSWDGLALIKRDKVEYAIEPHANGGNAILANEI